MHYMVCISGFAGAGKDECASQLTREYRALQTGLADPGKRHMADAYGFTEQQLFGPSPFRNAGDMRIEKNSFRELRMKKWNESLPVNLQTGESSKYEIDASKPYWTYETPHPEVLRPFLDKNERRYVFVKEGDPEFWLSPREALQIYLEKMNMLDVYTWIRKGVEDQLLLATGRWGYSRMRGLVRSDDENFEGVAKLDRSGSTNITCFADFRHIPEVQYVRELAARSLVPFTPILVRVKRPSIPVPPYNHRSETEQVKIRDAAFDAIVNNDQDLPHLYGQIDHVIHLAKTGKLPPNPWQESYVIPNRQPEEGYAP